MRVNIKLSTMASNFDSIGCWLRFRGGSRTSPSSSRATIDLRRLISTLVESVLFIIIMVVVWTLSLIIDSSDFALFLWSPSKAIKIRTGRTSYDIEVKAWNQQTLRVGWWWAYHHAQTSNAKTLSFLILSNSMLSVSLTPTFEAVALTLFGQTSNFFVKFKILTDANSKQQVFVIGSGLAWLRVATVIFSICAIIFSIFDRKHMNQIFVLNFHSPLPIY